ncbi:hypothetical protein SLEP1_g28453 [Rubroshorea leprosula]|uniref:Uncharacterized protein n=1 Tax=Rubroshorea leprosula TaxID=152421 RepID=A0AAV5JTR1_9ROSI|nr:hypothetical protein SLEP1_g28453 [Rubroshorea leprosula]
MYFPCSKNLWMISDSISISCSSLHSAIDPLQVVNASVTEEKAQLLRWVRLKNRRKLIWRKTEYFMVDLSFYVLLFGQVSFNYYSSYFIESTKIFFLGLKGGSGTVEVEVEVALGISRGAALHLTPMMILNSSL